MPNKGRAIHFVNVSFRTAHGGEHYQGDLISIDTNRALLSMLGEAFRSTCKDPSKTESKFVHLTGEFSITGLNVVEGDNISFDGDKVTPIDPDAVTRGVVRFLEKYGAPSKDLCVTTELSDRANGYEVLIAENRRAIRHHPQNEVVALVSNE